MGRREGKCWTPLIDHSVVYQRHFWQKRWKSRSSIIVVVVVGLVVGWCSAKGEEYPPHLTIIASGSGNNDRKRTFHQLPLSLLLLADIRQTREAVLLCTVKPHGRESLLTFWTGSRAWPQIDGKMSRRPRARIAVILGAAFHIHKHTQTHHSRTCFPLSLSHRRAAFMHTILVSAWPDTESRRCMPLHNIHLK